MDFDLSAGQLRSRLVIQRRTTSRDALGEPLDSWTEIGRRWADLEPLEKRNLDIAHGFAATVDYQAKLRYYADVDNDCRATCDGVTYFVNGVVHDRKRKRWTMLFLTSQQT